jgi:hypothetical protein
MPRQIPRWGHGVPIENEGEEQRLRISEIDFFFSGQYTVYIYFRHSPEHKEQAILPHSSILTMVPWL